MKFEELAYNMARGSRRAAKAFVGRGLRDAKGRLGTPPIMSLR
jgi:hypothetical protein